MGEIVGQAYLACKCIYLCSLIEARLFLGLDSLDDLAWAMISSLCKWMQFACVNDDELQSWVHESEKQGLLKIQDLPARARKLSFGDHFNL
jgi:hypothetical protein